jgi:hypothetical protein
MCAAYIQHDQHDKLFLYPDVPCWIGLNGACPTHFRFVICIFTEFSDDFFISRLFFGSSCYCSNIFFVILEMNFRMVILFL